MHRHPVLPVQLAGGAGTANCPVHPARDVLSYSFHRCLCLSITTLPPRRAANNQVYPVVPSQVFTVGSPPGSSAASHVRRSVRGLRCRRSRCRFRNHYTSSNAVELGAFSSNPQHPPCDLDPFGPSRTASIAFAGSINTLHRSIVSMMQKASGDSLPDSKARNTASHHWSTSNRLGSLVGSRVGAGSVMPSAACKSLSKVEFTPKLMKFSVYSSLFEGN